jgi:hypothetical protein
MKTKSNYLLHMSLLHALRQNVRRESPSVPLSNDFDFSHYVCFQNLRRQFEKFMDWRQCAAVMQRETVTVMPRCSGGGNVVVA